jgi:hypothetical protein
MKLNEAIDKWYTEAAKIIEKYYAQKPTQEIEKELCKVLGVDNISFWHCDSSSYSDGSDFYDYIDYVDEYTGEKVEYLISKNFNIVDGSHGLVYESTFGNIIVDIEVKTADKLLMDRFN